MKKLATILVEDSAKIRETLIPAMEELANLEVVAVAETATDAMHVLSQNAGRWQVCVVDMFLREGSGLQVVGACLQREAHQKVVVLTNYPTTQIRERCRELRADALFDKSNELDDFFEFCSSIGRADIG
jgi:DNA-binding NarL/FixJ family response regulator